jgi:hypothetical protein
LHGFLSLYRKFIEANHFPFTSQSENSGLKTAGPVSPPAPLYYSMQRRDELPRCAGRKTYFPPFAAALTVTFTWRGLDSSRFGRVTVSTPFLYSAPIASGFTVFGSEKLRLNAP